MTVYEIVTSYYDDGKVIVHSHTYEMYKKPENRVVETARYDRYHDYFTNKREAQKHYDDAKKA